MKFLFFMTFLFCLISCSTKNGGQKESSEVREISNPKKTNIVFDEELYDFGVLESGEIVVYRFKFTNSGSHSLKISKISSDCGCVRATFPETPVNAGESSYIEVEFNSAGLFGKQFKSIEIHANTEELKHLAIFAEVRNKNLEFKY